MVLNTHPLEVCEGILRNSIEYNTIHNILFSETEVAKRLLARSLELRDAYRELHDKLAATPPSLEAFLRVLLSVAAFWSPDCLEKAREQKKRLEAVNDKIAARAAELADLLDKRSMLENATPFGAGTHYHCIDVIVEAAADNHRFNSWVKEDLSHLNARFDLKYWPSLGEVIREIATDASDANVCPSDPITEASTSSKRHSLADFFRALRSAIDENSSRNFGLLPLDFKLSDDTLASLANCALDLQPEAIVDGPYVKRLRQRDREVEPAKGVRSQSRG